MKKSTFSFLLTAAVLMMVLAAGCQETQTNGGVAVTQTEYDAMTPAARAKGNYFVVSDLPQSREPNGNSTISIKTSAVLLGDKSIEPAPEAPAHQVSYDELNKSRTP